MTIRAQEPCLYGAGTRIDRSPAARKESCMSAQEDTAARGAQPRRKLGKGLGALLGEARREEPLVVTPGPQQTDGTGLPPFLASGATGWPVFHWPRSCRTPNSRGGISTKMRSTTRRVDRQARVIQPVIVRRSARVATSWSPASAVERRAKGTTA